MFLAGKNRANQAGVTLLEMIVVVSIIALMIAITFPSISAGMDSLKLRSAAGELTGMFNSALTRADRLQDAVEITVSMQRRSIMTHAIRYNITRRVDLPEHIHIAHIYPEDARWEVVNDAGATVERHFIVYPNGAVPRIAIDLANDRGAHRIVMLDPITGVARERTTQEPPGPTADGSIGITP